MIYSHTFDALPEQDPLRCSLFLGGFVRLMKTKLILLWLALVVALFIWYFLTYPDYLAGGPDFKFPDPDPTATPTPHERVSL